MFSILTKLFFLPIKFVLLIVELLGRTVALVLGLGVFGVGALFCLMGPFVLIGAPLCLLSGLLVAKAI